jgi:hypothetical protein
VSRIWIRGSNVGVRIFAVGLLVLGIAVGVTAGFLKKSDDTLTVSQEGQFKQSAVANFELPPADTDKPQPLPAGAKVKQVQAELAAQAKARAIAKAKADAARKAAKERAEAAARAAAERASRAKRTTAPSTGGGEQPPTAPVDCQTYSGHRQTGCSLLSWAGFGTDQMGCLDKLWTKESGWNPLAHNDSSGAHGIPQALPGIKMAEYGDDWETNPVPQIKWGLQYIKGRYGNPCDAWAHSQDVGWY